MWRMLLIVGSLLFAVTCFGSGLFLGLLGRTQHAYNLRYEEERDLVVPLVNADPAFSEIQINQLSSGGIFLTGEVPTQADLDRFTAEVTRLLGQPRVQKGIIAVSVRRLRPR